MRFDTNARKFKKTYSLLLINAECFLRHRNQILALPDRLDNLHTDAVYHAVCWQDASALESLHAPEATQEIWVQSDPQSSPLHAAVTMTGDTAATLAPHRCKQIFASNLLIPI